MVSAKQALPSPSIWFIYHPPLNKTKTRGKGQLEILKLIMRMLCFDTEKHAGKEKWKIFSSTLCLDQ